MLKIIRGILLICGGIFLLCAVALAVCLIFHLGHAHFDFAFGQGNQDKPAPAAAATAPPTVAEWSAFSTIEHDETNDRYKETVLIVNDNGTPTTFGEVTVAPGEAVQFVHWVAAARKKDLADSVNVEGVKGDVPVKRIAVQGTIKRDDLK